MSELQLRLDSVKEEAGANKIKLQVRKYRVTHTLTHALTPLPSPQALVAEWEQAQAEGGGKSLSAADSELKRKVEAMHAGQAKLALMKNQAAEAETALAALDKEMVTESTKASALQQHNAELLRQAADMQALLDERARTRAGLEQQLEKCEADDKAMAAEIHGFELRIKEAEARVKDKEKEKLGTKATLAALEIELQSSAQQLADADVETRGRIQALQQQKLALEEDAKGLRVELEALQAAAAAAVQESTLLAASQQEALGRLAEARKEVESLRASESTLSKQVAAAAEEHDAVAMREAKLQGELDGLRNEIQGGSARGELLQEEIDRLMQDRANVTAASSPLQPQLEDLRRSLAAALVERDALTSELRDAEQQLIETGHGAAACARKLAEVHEREAEAVGEFNRAKAALAAAEADHRCVCARACACARTCTAH